MRRWEWRLAVDTLLHCSLGWSPPRHRPGEAALASWHSTSSGSPCLLSSDHPAQGFTGERTGVSD